MTPIPEVLDYVNKAKLGRNIIVRLEEDNYIFWSNVVDKPVAWGASREEMIEILNAWGHIYTSERAVEQRLELLDKYGTTEMLGADRTMESTVRFNYAGPNGECLTIDALKSYYGPGDAHERFELHPGDVVPREDDD